MTGELEDCACVALAVFVLPLFVSDVLVGSKWMVGRLALCESEDDLGRLSVGLVV